MCNIRVLTAEAGGSRGQSRSWRELEGGMVLTIQCAQGPLEGCWKVLVPLPTPGPSECEF